MLGKLPSHSSGNVLTHSYRLLVSLLLYAMLLVCMSLMTAGGRRPDTEMAYTPFLKRPKIEDRKKVEGSVFDCSNIVIQQTYVLILQKK